MNELSNPLLIQHRYMEDGPPPYYSQRAAVFESLSERSFGSVIHGVPPSFLGTIYSRAFNAVMRVAWG